MKTIFRTVLAAVVIGAAVGVRAEISSYPYKVTATVGMVNDIVEQVAGEYAICSNIIGEGIDPHLYRTTRSDINQLMTADIIFYSGLLLEGKMGSALEAAGKRKPVYAVTELLEKEYLLSPPEFQGHADPHVWMDVKAWSKAVDVVATALSEQDPTHADDYRKRATAYQVKLKELNDYATTSISSIPESQRIMITAHDAFNYFGRAYGLQVVGIQGLSTESEAGLQDIRRLVDLLVEKQVKAVFTETSVSDKNVKALIEGAGAQGHNVVIGGLLFSDAMGPEGMYEGSYIGMIDHNITTVTRALGGNAPEKGMQDKLNGMKH
ncbi:MAG: zinc ABC transporter substrate-binding protein [Pontiella sp.]